MEGKVTFIGAGPGETGLLTMKGASALRSAEVVVYDRLVGEGILRMIPKSAERINAGKSGSRHLMSQEEINDILVKKALEGKNVARLKGGDPFVFGRGGEELEALCQNGIEFEVIPGVTSATAVPAYAGIPVTHRDKASSLHIITGHAREGKELDIDFEACVKMKGTLVFLMGRANLEFIADGLIKAGMSAKTPCVLIENGTLPSQRKILSTLGNICRDAADADAPAVIVVGEVCAYSEDFDWFDRLPLKGRRVVVTRPKKRNAAFIKKLEAVGAQTIECSCIKTTSLVDNRTAGHIRTALERHSWAAFSSAAGVEAVFEGLYAAGMDARVFGSVRLAVVGEATSKKLREYGIKTDLLPMRSNSEALGNALVFAAERNDNVLLLISDASDGTLKKILNKNGIEFTEIPAYHTEYEAERDLTEEINAGEIDYVCFTSPSTLRAFMETHKNADKSRFTGVCIGEKTERAARESGINYVTAKKTSEDGMIEIMTELNR